MRIRLVGRFTVRVGDRVLPDVEVGTRKARTVLAVLAAYAGRPVTADELADAVWPTGAPQQPGANLATLVSRLRATFGDDLVLGDRVSWTLGPRAEVDLRSAESLLARARLHAQSDEPGPAFTAAEAALHLLADARVLPDEPEAEWAEHARVLAAELLREARHLGAAAAAALGDTRAGTLAAAAVESDPYDETAVRLLMRSHAQADEPARALAVYERLRRTLADELGADPAAETQAVHTALLADAEVPVARVPTSRTTPAAPPPRSELAGRDVEAAALRAAWSAVTEGRPSLVLLTGEAGIGKTRLATDLVEHVAASGGTVLSARCYRAERSVLLQPFADALRPVVVGSSAPELRELVGDRAQALSAVVPEIRDVVALPPGDGARAGLRRNQANDAVLQLLRRLSTRHPVLLMLDDVHNAGLATVELLHLVARRTVHERLLVVAAVRSDEGAEAITALSDVADRIELGPLTPEAVHALARAHGQGEHATRIAARSGGHPLFAVELLRALDAGDTGVPQSLRDSVESRVRAAGPELEELARAASVLGSVVDTGPLAALVGADDIAVVRRCERLVSSRVLAHSGEGYEFVHDLVQEVLYDSTPRRLRQAYHRRAVGLYPSRPEAGARHAEAAEVWDAAAEAWLAAADAAALRYVLADSERMCGRALSAADLAGSATLQVGARLARAHVRQNLEDYQGALHDLTAALDVASAAGLHGLALLVRRELSGDVLVALGRPLAASVVHLDAGLVLARELRDHAREADLLARSAVLAANRLQFVRAVEDGTRAVELARAVGDTDALALALDGLKTPYAYLGDIARLTPVVEELEPLCRSSRDLFRLQWCVFESSFRPLAAGRWAEATAVVEEALALNRRSGWVAFESWFLAHLGWIARLAGRLDEAVDHGRRSVAARATVAHPWWDATACAMYATSLVADDPERHREQAVRLLRRGLAAADRTAAEGYRLRCLAGLAELTAAPDLRDQAQLLHDRMRLPAGSAWLHGIDAHLSLARAWLRDGDTTTAQRVLDPVAVAGSTCGWNSVLRASGLDTLRQTSSASAAAARSAPPGRTGS